jgi:hypothetical protein
MDWLHFILFVIVGLEGLWIFFAGIAKNDDRYARGDVEACELEIAGLRREIEGIRSAAAKNMAAVRNENSILLREKNELVEGALKTEEGYKLRERALLRQIEEQRRRNEVCYAEGYAKGVEMNKELTMNN